MLKYLFLLSVLFLPSLHAERIAVVSLAIGDKYQKCVHAGFLNKTDYCKKQGYDFYYITENLDSTRHPAWSKIKAVEKILPNYDWVFWTDADSLIMNPKIRLEQIIDNRYFMVICKQYDGIINSGEFLIKNTPRSFKFLKDVYKPEYKDLGWFEQASVILNIGLDEYKSNVKILPQEVMNAKADQDENLGCYRRGDFIQHFYGFGCSDRLEKDMWKWYCYAKKIQHNLEPKLSHR